MSEEKRMTESFLLMWLPTNPAHGLDNGMGQSPRH
jgi:hypothetical protein